MVEILNLALPYFGLIFIGFACGKAKKLPEQGLVRMNFVRGGNRLAERSCVKMKCLVRPHSSPRRRQSLTHGKAAKRSERADQMQAGCAQRLHRQYRAEQ
jgi:hypothetical protein